MSFTTVKPNKCEYNLHTRLKLNIDKLSKANKRDWDFKILISGDGMTRTGKTTIGGQLAKYLDPYSTEKNWVYGGGNLIPTAKKLGRGAVVVYDESKEGLDSKKSMQKYSQNIVDYFNECGYLNQYLIIILPDFFDLNKSVALNLSICLINVKVTGNFHRGYFDFYSRKSKRWLYIKGKRFNEYSAHKPTFDGKFIDYFPYNYSKLEQMKKQAISDRQAKIKPKIDRNERAAWKLSKEHLWTQTQIADLFEVTQQAIGIWIKRHTSITNYK